MYSRLSRQQSLREPAFYLSGGASDSISEVFTATQLLKCAAREDVNIWLSCRTKKSVDLGEDICLALDDT
jgi:hypothetical protein